MDKIRRAAELVELIRRLGHECAVVGGVAVSIRTRERFTKDVDFAVAVGSDAESEALARAMQDHGLELTTVVEQEAKGLVATLRFRDPRSPTPEPSVDLVCASCGIEPEIVAKATLVEFSPGISLPVARLPHLIAMKVLSVDEVRHQDRGDLQALFAVASKEEVTEAREAVKLIAKRGFHRGKDLEAEFERHLQRNWEEDLSL